MAAISRQSSNSADLLFLLRAAPAHHFELPKVLRFRDWLREVCSQFPPPEGERLEPEGSLVSRASA